MKTRCKSRSTPLRYSIRPDMNKFELTLTDANGVITRRHSNEYEG